MRVCDGNCMIWPPESNRKWDKNAKRAWPFKFVSNLAYPTLACLREIAEEKDWPRTLGLVVTHCHHSILRRCSCEAPAANERHYRESTLSILPDLSDLTF